MDEPTVGLDPGGRHIVWDHVRALNRDLGSAVVLTTHYMDEADELCHRVGMICAGKLKAIGTPAELKERYAPGAGLDEVYAALIHTDGTQG
jgi:ABC-2 type transport system ATP-binding protein